MPFPASLNIQAVFHCPLKIDATYRIVEKKINNAMNEFPHENLLLISEFLAKTTQASSKADKNSKEKPEFQSYGTYNLI